jgi:hypothetical protein
VCITVSETGMGMSDQTRGHLFEPYYTTKSRDSGTGLGLHSVLRTINQHGGGVRVTSAPGKGTVVELLLPVPSTSPGDSDGVRDADYSTPAAAALEQPPGAGVAARLQAPRAGAAKAMAALGAAVEMHAHLLVVDDEKSILDLMCIALRRSGYEVTPFCNAGEAIAAFRASPDRFAAVITDLSMPLMSGTELAAQIKQAAPATPVLLCTGYRDITAHGVQGAPLYDALLSKPFDLAGLMEAVHKLLTAGYRGRN